MSPPFSLSCYFNISLNLYRVSSYLYMVPNWVHINWQRRFETTYSRKKVKKNPSWFTHKLATRIRNYILTKKQKIPVDAHITWQTRIRVTVFPDIFTWSQIWSTSLRKREKNLVCLHMSWKTNIFSTFEGFSCLKKSKMDCYALINVWFQLGCNET